MSEIPRLSRIQTRADTARQNADVARQDATGELEKDLTAAVEALDRATVRVSEELETTSREEDEAREASLEKEREKLREATEAAIEREAEAAKKD